MVRSKLREWDIPTWRDHLEEASADLGAFEPLVGIGGQRLATSSAEHLCGLAARRTHLAALFSGRHPWRKRGSQRFPWGKQVVFGGSQNEGEELFREHGLFIQHLEDREQSLRSDGSRRSERDQDSRHFASRHTDDDTCARLGGRARVEPEVVLDLVGQEPSERNGDGDLRPRLGTIRRHAPSRA